MRLLVALNGLARSIMTKPSLALYHRIWFFGAKPLACPSPPHGPSRPSIACPSPSCHNSHFVAHIFNIFTLSFLFKGIPSFGSGLFTAFNNGKVSAIISIVRTLVFNLLTIVVVPVLFFYLFGSSYEAAFYGVWYSIVFSEILATIMTVRYLKKYKTVYEYA